MTERYVDGQPELAAITAPRLQFAQGFPNAVFQLDVERRVAAERGGDAVLREIKEPHASLQWADYKFGPLRRVMNRKETRSRAYVTELRFGPFEASEKQLDEKGGNDVGTPDSCSTSGNSEKPVAKKVTSDGSHTITRLDFRRAYFSLCSYADRMTVYAGHLPAIAARDRGSPLGKPLAEDAVEQVKKRTEAVRKAVGECFQVRTPDGSRVGEVRRRDLTPGERA